MSLDTIIGSDVKKAELRRRIAYDNLIAIELEKRRREKEEKGEIVNQIQPNHLAHVSAFPLRQFIYETFPILEPGYTFKSNWHIDAMAELLQAATIGEVKNFLINIPPRCGKSTLFCVMWFCWAWSFLPHTRWLFSSYSEKFAKRDGDKCRYLIRSAYYQRKFGDVFMLTTPDTPSNFYNSALGFRKAFGVKGATGDGADFLLVDDGNRIDEYESDKMLESVANWYFSTYYNRVNNPSTAVRGNIQQRIGIGDLTSYILERELNFQVLCLPMNWEDDHPHTNSVSKPLKLGKVTEFDSYNSIKKREKDEKVQLLNIGEEKLWIDPRQLPAKDFENKWYQNWFKESYADKGYESDGEGELLWREHFTPEVVVDLIKAVELYGEAAQLQQRPIKKGGNFFKSEHFLENGRPVNPKSVDLNGYSFCRYWDKAGTSGAGDFTVGMLVARSPKRPYQIYIIDVVYKQVSYHERMELMIETAKEDTLNYVDALEDTEYSVGIEKEPASSGKDLATIEKEALVGYDVFIDKPRGKKSFRAKPAKSYSEANRIKIFFGTWNQWFFRVLERFDPDKESQVDDPIDTLSGAFKKLIFGVSSGGSSSGGTY